MRNHNIPEPPPPPEFPALREPLTPEGVREMVRLEWFETVCPICRGMPAGSSEAGSHAVTFYVCPTCKAFSLSWAAREAVKTASADERRRLSEFAAASAAPVAFDDRLLGSVKAGADPAT